jgi:hypothetical protein
MVPFPSTGATGAVGAATGCGSPPPAGGAPNCGSATGPTWGRLQRSGSMCVGIQQVVVGHHTIPRACSPARATAGAPASSRRTGRGPQNSRRSGSSRCRSRAPRIRPRARANAASASRACPASAPRSFPPMRSPHSDITRSSPMSKPATATPNCVWMAAAFAACARRWARENSRSPRRRRSSWRKSGSACLPWVRLHGFHREPREAIHVRSGGLHGDAPADVLRVVGSTRRRADQHLVADRGDRARQREARAAALVGIDREAPSLRR